VIPSFKIGDTIKVITRLQEDDGTPVDISSKTIRSVLKRGTQEILGTNQLLSNFILMTLFSTDAAVPGKYQTDVRFTNGAESFATSTVVVEIGERIS